MSNSSSKISEDNKYYNLPVNPNRVYFDPVIGVPLKDNEMDDNLYKIDPTDERDFAEGIVDQLTDVCDKDKVFFKMWNEFITNREKYNYKAEECLNDFLANRGDDIFKYDLRPNFCFHCLVMYEDRIIDKEVYARLINRLENMFHQYAKNKLQK